MEQNIFISYRRADSEGYAGRIYDRLQAHFGDARVFMDVTDIGLGADFANAIDQAIGTCRVVIVLIGPRWHDMTDEMGRKRLDDPHDFVRIEVQAALTSGALVVPVLLYGAKMPKAADLPADLRPLTRRNAVEIRHRRFDVDVAHLIAELHPCLDETETPAEPPRPKKLGLMPIWGWALILILLVGVLGLGRALNQLHLAAPAATETLAVRETAVSLVASATATLPPPTATATLSPSPTSPPPTLTPPPTATHTPSLTPTITPLPPQIQDPFGVSMVLVPEGTFIMGTDRRQPWDLVSRPARVISLNLFYIDKYEVSNAQYAECVAAGVCTSPKIFGSRTRHQYFDNPEYADYPVVYVSWFNARTYCSWRSGRLPSEAEWEKTARSDDQRAYPWGADPADCQHTNFWPTDACEGDTLPVDSQYAGVSPYGAYNLSGNVAEWVNDWFQAFPGGDPNATKEFGITHRVNRGGAYFDGPNNVRATARKGLTPGAAHSYVGFRCVVDVEDLP